MRKKRVLWLEDAAHSKFRDLAVPLYMQGTYELIVAEDVSTAASLVETTEFDALIVDIRVPPGTDPEWIEAYQKRGQDIAGARLGVEFLRSVMRHPKALVHLEQPPVWLRPTSVAVFSVERRERLVDELEGLEIGHFLQKTAYISKSALLDTVEAVMRSDGPSTDGGREEG